MLSVSDLPSGVTGSFSPTSTRTTSTLTLTADAGATLGSSTFTVTRTADGCTVSISVPISISGFHLEVTPESADLQRGATGDYTVTVFRTGDFSSAVALAVSNLPSGVTRVFSPNSVTPTANTPNPTSTLTATENIWMRLQATLA